MESWKAWAILCIIIIIAVGVGFGIAKYMANSQPVEGQTQKETVNVPAQKVEEPVSQLPPEAIPQTPQPIEAQPQLSDNTNLKKIIDLYDSSVNGLLYYFQDDKYFLKNNKIKIELKNLRDTSQGIFNVVYLDTKTREAVAFCHELDDSTGKKCEGLKKIPVQVEYNQFYTLTPVDWMDRVRTAQNSVVTFKAKTLFNRRVDEIVWGQGAGQTTVFVDHTFGAPIEIIQGTQKWDYFQMGINQVAATDVTRPDS